MQVRVPASSANLGPGFDSLGLALGIYLTCRFQRAGRLSIRVSGRDAAEIPTGEDNLIWRTALAVAADIGDALPPIALEIDNDIPLGKGLGSSAAALTERPFSERITARSITFCNSRIFPGHAHCINVSTVFTGMLAMDLFIRLAYLRT